MQLKKILCISCPAYRQCPPRTKMFVNYCGSDAKNFEQNIREAAIDCRSRRGYLLQTGFFLKLQVEPAATA